MVAFSAVPGRDGQRVALPSPVPRQKLRLARTLANLVIVYVHWGSELLDWPDDSQQRSAGWLIRQGADVIIGHHPHVVQPPDCVLGKPVFYSLGNHLFDQKYPASKAGLIADCSIVDGAVACAGIMTQTPAGSAFPQVKAAGGQSEHEDKTRVLAAGCRPRLSSGLIVNGITLRPLIHDGQGSSGELVLEARRAGQLLWTTGPRQLLSIETARMAGPQRPELLFTLERHPSPLDHEQGLRPYVYEVGARGLTARWRGTALAWPLLDAALLPDGNGLLCALHRGDSFLVPEPHTPHARLAMYRWNGFGFSGVDDAGLLQRCQEIIGSAD
jgi:hypothetical protein